MTHQKQLGRWHGAGLLTTTLLGTSVFILPQMTIDNAGYGALIAWAGLTLSILPVAWVFAKLTGKYPHAGGPAYFAELAFGATAGRTIGMLFLCIVPLGAPAALIMTYQFVASVYTIPDSKTIWVQLGFIPLLFALNVRGLQLSANLQLLLTLFITGVVIAMLTALGFSTLSASITPLDQPLTITPIMTAAGIAFWSFLGVEAISHLADDFKDPRRDLVPAMLIGTVTVGLIYLGCTYLLIRIPSETSLAMVGAFDVLFGHGGNLLIGLLGVAGGLATVNVYTASLTRLITSFAEQGVLPSYFSKTNSAGVSTRSLLGLLSLMAAVLVLSHALHLELEDMLAWVNGVFAIIYLAAMIAAYKLLPHSPKWIIHLSVLFCIGMFIGIGFNMLYAVVLMLLLLPLMKLQVRKLVISNGN